MNNTKNIYIFLYDNIFLNEKIIKFINYFLKNFL